MNGQNSGAQHQHPQKSRGSRSSSFDAGTAYETTANAQYQPDGTAQAEDQIIELTGAKAPEEMTRKCWICFEEELESEIIKQGSESDWRSPCQCSLAAHEECLLTWVDETQKSTSTGVNSSRTIRCPQCKQAYKIRSKYSVGVNLMTIADQWITRALLATIPLGVIKSLGITCFYYGQGAILDVLVCLVLCCKSQANAPRVKNGLPRSYCLLNRVMRYATSSEPLSYRSRLSAPDLISSISFSRSYQV